MELIIMRHGIAEEAGPATANRDAPRRLTEDGRHRIRLAASGLAALRIQPDVLLTSPLVRCQETAEIVAAALGCELEADGRLAPGMDLADLTDAALDRPDAATLMVCGHQPDCSQLVAALTGGMVEFRKGMVACVSMDTLRHGGGVLRALYPPAVLRRLGGAS